jgi:hypothetical protein
MNTPPIFRTLKRKKKASVLGTACFKAAQYNLCRLVEIGNFVVVDSVQLELCGNTGDVGTISIQKTSFNKKKENLEIMFGIQGCILIL